MPLQEKLLFIVWIWLKFQPIGFLGKPILESKIPSPVQIKYLIYKVPLKENLVYVDATIFKFVEE